MNKKRNANYNLNYFTKSDSLKFIGICCLALLIPFYLFQSFIFYPYLLMCIAAPVGFVLFIVGSLGKTSDSDMDSIVQHNTYKVELDFESNRRYERNLAKHLPPHFAEGYEYKDGLHYKKAKSGVLRSNEYFKTAIYTFANELAVVVRKVDLINEKATTETYFFPFSELTNVAVKNEKMTIDYKKKRYIIHADHLSFMKGDEALLTVPLHSDIIFEQYVERLNEHISSKRSTLSE